ASSRFDVSRPSNQRVHESRTSCLEIDRRTFQLQPILHEAGRGWETHVRRASGYQKQIDIAWFEAGGIKATCGSLDRQIRCGLVRQCVAALADSRLLDDPLAVATEALFEMFVGDKVIRHIARSSKDANTHQTATAATIREGFGCHSAHPNGAKTV